MSEDIGPVIPEALKRPNPSTEDETEPTSSKIPRLDVISGPSLPSPPSDDAVRNQENEETSEEPVFKQPALPPVKTLKFEETYLRALPRATQYEKSFMHRDTVSHVFATQTDFIITASIDGHLKFWKKIHREGVEFVKHFRCYLHAFSDIAVNHNGTLMATVCTEEKTVKIFDVVNFDMINMFKHPFAPKIAAWVHVGSDLVHALAISDAASPKIFIYDGKGENVPIHMIESLHSLPVKIMEYIPAKNITISIDERGMLEYWSGARTNYEFPKNVPWEFKGDTDLYEFAKLKAPPKSLAVSPSGNFFATFSADRSLKIFDVLTGKIVKTLDESLNRYVEEAKLNNRFNLPNVDWTRKVAQEKDINKDSTAFDFVQMSFDESGNFLIYPSPVGLRIYNVVTEKIVRDIGKVESTRFLGAAVCRAVPTTVERLKGAAITAEVAASDNPALQRSEPDPMVIALAYKKNRFYIFTNAEPFTLGEDATTEAGGNRDVFNEKPRKEDALTTVDDDEDARTMTDEATVHTSYGDIHVKLFPKECPKAVENFITLARRGYYNGHVFHRVIKSFIIQTGDPTGKGTGGQSIYGADFEDEFHPMLRHDKPYRLSMANAGPNTNGSQFFITVVPAEFLDGKNTLFGEVTDGFSVVQKINQTPTYEKSGRPRNEISIVSITLKN
uniref:peptidylprolyl isomerase n=1 Tax=Panagrellus redivivus TaxID=6233 RepID=A0A7E4ZZR6_PANRE